MAQQTIEESELIKVSRPKINDMFTEVYTAIGVLENTVDGLEGGVDGEDGASAYEVAISNGFVGTEVEWLASLVGEQGPQGEKGDTGDTGPQGEQGQKGDTGDTGAQGEQGLKGDAGDAGPAGPNEITTETETDIAGVLKGNGSTIEAVTVGTDVIEGDGTVTKIVKLTQAAYDLLDPPHATTHYLIVEAS